MKAMQLMFVSAMILCLGLNTYSMGQYPGVGTFEKITSMEDLEDGYYVIASTKTGGEDFVAMDSEHSGVFFPAADITPVDDSLQNPSADIVWWIETNGAGRIIYNEVTEKYASYTGSANNIQEVDDVTTDNQRWSFTYVEDLFKIENLEVEGRYIQYNRTFPRFACYTDSQIDITLFKLGEFEEPTLILLIPDTIDQGETIQGSVVITEAAESDLDVDLTSSHPADLQVPASVTISNGMTTATFDIEASPFDDPGDPDIEVTITANADGYDPVEEDITIINTLAGAIALTTEGYEQDFADFDSAETLPSGWSVDGLITTYLGDWGDGISAGMRGNDNVLGYQHTGSTEVFDKIASFRNDTGEEITDLTISYLGRVERVGEGRTPSYTVTVDGDAVPGLAYSTSSGVDEQRTVTLSGLSIEADALFDIVWSSDGSTTGSPGSGSRRQIGIGDFSIMAGDPPTNLPPIIVLDPPGAEKEVYADHPISFDVIGDQEPGDAGQETELYATELPSGAIFPGATGAAPVQSTFDWTPAVVGVYTAIFEAADTDGVATQKVTITVTEDPDLPIPIAPGMPVSEDFDSIGTSATATLPSGWKADKLTTVRTVGTFADAVNQTERAGGNNLGTTAANGIYNFGAPETGDEDRAIGFLSSAAATRSGNLYVYLVNAGDSPIANLFIEYDVEKYRRGSNPDGFQIQLYYSMDGENWTNAGAAFLTQFDADADNTGYDVVPGETVPVSGALDLSATPIPVDGNIYLAWSYSVQDGTGTANAQALAVDNVEISADEPELSVSVDKPDGFKVEFGTEETITAMAQGGEPPYVFDWDSGLQEDDWNAVSNVFTILDTAPMGVHTAKVTVTDFELDEADTSVTFSVESKYTIITNVIGNGTVETDPADSAFAGVTVTIIAEPAAGHVVDDITVTGDDTTDITVTDNTFTMPAQGVTVTVTFEPEPIPPGLLVLYDFEDETNAPAITAANLSASLFVASDGRAVTYPSGNPGDAISATGWDEAGRYWEFSITVDGGYEMSITELSFDENASGTGPTNWFLRSSLDDFVSDLATGAVDTSWDTEIIPLTLEGITGTIEFRLYGEGASGGAGTWRIDNVELSGTVEDDDPPDPDPDEPEFDEFVVAAGVPAQAHILNSQEGYTYILEYTTDLTDPEGWEIVESKPGTGAPLDLEDDDPADVMRIYRIRVIPTP